MDPRLFGVALHRADMRAHGIDPDENQFEDYEMRGRQTGRTSRMLADAFEQARKGRAVYVVAANVRHAHHLEDMAGSVAKELGIKFETPETLGNFDWRTMSLKNAHPNCVAIVDHYAIECEYSALLEMLHRYDSK